MTRAPDPADRPGAPSAPSPAATPEPPASAIPPTAPAGPAAPARSAPAAPTVGADAPDSSSPPRLPDGPGLLGADGLRPVSPRLVPARYLAGVPGYVIGAALVVAAIVGAALLARWWIAPIGLVPLILVLQGLLLTPRRVRALGYLDGPEELTIASGIMFREVSTIPYGRIQSVKIDEGPIDRRFGLAQLTMTTAAAGPSVTLPGLPREEAERLRQLLTERGIERMAAL